jgi:hypothetical protein
MIGYNAVGVTWTGIILMNAYGLSATSIYRTLVSEDAAGLLLHSHCRVPVGESEGTSLYQAHGIVAHYATFEMFQNTRTM